MRVLVCTGDLTVLHAVSSSISLAGGGEVESRADLAACRSLLETEEFMALVVDDRILGDAGWSALRDLRRAGGDELGIWSLVEEGAVDRAVAAMRHGADECIIRPVQESRVLSMLRERRWIRDLREENRTLRDSVRHGGLRDRTAFEAILTEDPEFRRILLYVDAVAGSGQPVLVTGETGTGKELVARAIHAASGRKGRFVVVDTAAIDESLFVDTLFGHERGAYTGAERARSGLVEQAEGGTLFLDEIGKVGAGAQARLLRFLQEREFLPLGADRPVRSDVRIVAAGTGTAGELQDDPEFRRDLFFRLCAHHVHLPPLRQRRGDIPMLLDHFLDEAARSMGTSCPAYPPELVVLLATAAFPGNVRQLRAMVYDAVANHRGGVLSLRRFRERLDGENRSGAERDFPTLEEAETWLLREAIRRCGGNRSQAARVLGVSRQALYRKLATAGVEDGAEGEDGA